MQYIIHKAPNANYRMTIPPSPDGLCGQANRGKTQHIQSSESPDGGCTRLTCLRLIPVKQKNKNTHVPWNRDSQENVLVSRK